MFVVGIHLECGLGNILFQLACAIAVAKMTRAHAIHITDYQPQHNTTSHAYFWRGLQWDPSAYEKELGTALVADTPANDMKGCTYRETWPLILETIQKYQHEPLVMISLIGFFQNTNFFMFAEREVRAQFYPSLQIIHSIRGGMMCKGLDATFLDHALFVHIRSTHEFGHHGHLPHTRTKRLRVENTSPPQPGDPQ
jgi:hypothetical protein